MLVKEFMSTEVVTITEDKNMLEVRELMRSSDKRRLPVVDDISRVRGIITDADVSRTSPTDATTLSRYEANYLLGKLKVRDVMTKNVITVHYDAGVEDAAYLLYKNKINALPVVDDDNKLCGIITDSDIFRAFRPDIPQCLYPVFGHCMVRARQVTDVPFHRRICIHCDTYPCSEPNSYVQGREGPYFHLSRICPVVYRRGACDKRLLHLRHH